MSKTFCPQCDEIIEPASINVEKGIALCRKCGHASRASDIITRERPTKEILSKVPHGCSIKDCGDKIVVKASLRSTGLLFLWSGVCLFWNGLLTLFLIGAIGGIYHNLIGPLPAWVPPPKVEGGGMMTLGMAVGMLIFLIPFIVIGAGFIATVLIIANGSIQVEFSDTEGNVIKGVGLIRRRQRFDPHRVDQVSFHELHYESASQSRYVIMIKADQTIQFGSTLQDRRKEWLEAVLRSIFISRDETLRSNLLDRARQLISTLNKTSIENHE